MIDSQVSRGWGRAVRASGNPQIRNALWEYNKLTSDAARAAFVDKWARLAAGDIDSTWAMFYDSLRIIKEGKLYENASIMEDQKPRASFQEYWEDVAQKPFQTWADLESTYRHIEKHCPDLLHKITYTDARARRTQELAKVTKMAPTREQHPGGRPKPSDDNVISRSTGLGNAAPYLTARIARDRPDILARMKAGEFPSVRAAALEAGIVDPTFTCPLDPVKAARRILRHFTGDRLTQLISELSKPLDSG